jgi:outer membrane protein
MKKILLSAAMMIAAVSFANAQWFIGGNVGFSTATNEFELFGDDIDMFGDNAEKSTSFSILPKVGYIFNDQWMVGLGIGYSSTITETDNVDNSKFTNSVFAVNPFARYTAWCVGDFSLAFQADLGLGFGSMKVDVDNSPKPKTTSIGFNIAPVVQYNLTSSVMLESRLNFASLGYNSLKVDVDEEGVDAVTNSEFGFGIDADNAFTTGLLNVGFIVKF